MAPHLDAVTFDYWDTLVRTSFGATRQARRLALEPVLAGFGEIDVIVVVLDACVTVSETFFDAIA